MSVDNSQCFASFWNGKLHMAEEQTKRDGCGLEGRPARDEIQESHPRKEAGTFITWITMALVFLQSKTLSIIQIPTGSLCANASAATWPL